MRVAVVGSRGMPGVHGGIERHVEELYPRLAARGVDVTVYARREYVRSDMEVDGVHVVSLPSFGGRGGEALSHTALSLAQASTGRFDILHVHGIGPGILLPLARALGFRRTVLTFHANDYDRAKWGACGKAFLRQAEKVSVRNADQVIVVSRSGALHLERTYHRPVTYIPNGPGRFEKTTTTRMIEQMCPGGQDFVLFVGRLIPEKRPHDLVAAIEAFPDLDLVLAGDSSFTDGYAGELRRRAGDNVHFPGYVYGTDLAELYCAAVATILPSEVEGLSISLLEAMSLGCPVIVSDIPGNREALGEPEAGVIYPVGDCRELAACIGAVRDDQALRERLAQLAEQRVQTEYDWDLIADQTLEVYRSLLA